MIIILVSCKMYWVPHKVYKRLSLLFLSPFVCPCLCALVCCLGCGGPGAIQSTFGGSDH